MHSVEVKRDNILRNIIKLLLAIMQKKCRKEKKKRALGACFHWDRKGLYVEEKLALSHFLNKEK